MDESVGFMWDPRMMVGPPYTECLNCHQEQFGTLSISKNHWTRRCRNCLKDATTRLPALQKRIIYVDQMVLSNMAKALDPVWRATRKAQDPYWLDLFDQLERLVKLQVVVCVESPIQDEESAVTPYVDTLRRLREYFSAMVQFESRTIVMQHQLYRALAAVEAGLPVTLETYLGGGAHDVIHGRLDQWGDRMQISVNFKTSAEEIQGYRSSRDEVENALVTIWARWLAQRGRRFEDWYDEERRAIYPTWMEFYEKHVQRLERQMGRVGISAEEVESLIPSTTVMVVSGLIQHFRDAGCSLLEAHVRLRVFFASEAAIGAPANDISALLWAALARKAVSGQKKIPNRGTLNDINAISSYLPYCEALFVDDQFAGLLRDEPLLSKIRPYGSRIFSNRTRGEFLAYLLQIEAGAPADHLARVTAVYGEGWLTPFRSILEDERARRGSDAGS